MITTPGFSLGDIPARFTARTSAFGTVNISVAFILGHRLPDALHLLSAGAISLGRYGISLVAFVLALRHLGAARTGAYFSTAPFVGAGLSLLLLHETPALSFWIAGGLMALGVWLHVSEVRKHTHEALEHEHLHTHDNHHQHAHDFAWDGEEPHAHAHQHTHTSMTHSHPHYPDLHHRHRHRHRHRNRHRNRHGHRHE
jgi:hypothetical protein